ncbi:GatB/YqeY domain-containing protein [Acetobacteraceae bacterium]|nr:GatB/YqeY domain-containing protein [Acetobacteraceae bacterium]
MTDISLRQKIMNDIKTSMKEGNKEEVARLRAITAKFKDLDIEARVSGVEVDADQLQKALRSMVKSRLDSIALYEKGNRPELVAKEQAEIETIKRYLPPEIDEEKLKAEIEKIILALPEASMKEMGNVMGQLKEKFGAALDAGKAGKIVRERLMGKK